MGGKRTNVPEGKQQAVGAGSDIDAFLAGKRHPLERDIHWVRKVILALDPSTREEIKWNSISFRNDYDFFATVNLRSTESLKLVLYTGVKRKGTAETGVHVDDPQGLVEKWPAKDRCIVNLSKGAALEANKAAFSALLKGWLEFVR